MTPQPPPLLSLSSCPASPRQAAIVVDGKHVGIVGVVNPEVLARFDVVHPCSAVELD